MRKYVRFIILSIILVLIYIPVFASTNTKVRDSSNNYLVDSDVTVTDETLKAILVTPAVDEKEKIYDFGELYTSSEEAVLYDKVSKYIKSYNIDFAIVTVNQNQMVSSEDFARAFYYYNKFGFNEKKDGIVFLIDMKYRQIFMLTSGKAKDLYEDGKKSEALKSAVSYVKDKEYYQGTLNFINSVDSLAISSLPAGEVSVSRKVDDIPWISLFVISAIITLIVILVLVKKNKLVNKANSSASFLVKDNSEIKLVQDTFMGSNITKRAKVHNNSSGNSHRPRSSGGNSSGMGIKF